MTRYANKSARLLADGRPGQSASGDTGPQVKGANETTEVGVASLLCLRGQNGHHSLVWPCGSGGRTTLWLWLGWWWGAGEVRARIPDRDYHWDWGAGLAAVFLLSCQHWRFPPVPINMPVPAFFFLSFVLQLQLQKKNLFHPTSCLPAYYGRCCCPLQLGLASRSH